LPAHTAVHSHTVYSAVHGPCTRAVNTPGYRVHDRVGVPCIRPWTHHVHGPCTPVYTVRTRRERPCTRPYTRYIHRRAHGPKHGRLQGRVHGHGRTMYVAVYTVSTRPYTGHAHGQSVSRTRSCTQPVGGKTRPGTRPEPDRVRTVYTAVHGPCTVYTAVYTAVFTARVLGRVRTMYTAVHGPSMTRTRPCTRSCTLYMPWQPLFSFRWAITSVV